MWLGVTNSCGNGGDDAFLLEVSAQTGEVLDNAFWGGTGVDRALDVELVDNKLFVVGYTDSYGSGGKDVFVLSPTITGDADGDGVNDDVDNCQTYVNTDQSDRDADGMGDVCDVCPDDSLNDADGDGICGNVDNCPAVANANQADIDGDGIGDACDSDNDNDGVIDTVDNCPAVANVNQADIDGDGIGDACDSDDDNDGVVDGVDQCLATPIGAVVDANGCAIVDYCPCLNDWKNHGAYVSWVARTAENFVASGLLTEVQKDAIVSEAGASICGDKK